jgi:hypothetical protein
MAWELVYNEDFVYIDDWTSNPLYFYTDDVNRRLVAKGTSKLVKNITRLNCPIEQGSKYRVDFDISATPSLGSGAFLLGRNTATGITDLDNGILSFSVGSSGFHSFEMTAGNETTDNRLCVVGQAGTVIYTLNYIRLYKYLPKRSLINGPMITSGINRSL